MKGFGVFLIVAAVVCGVGALTQTQETELERLNQNIVSSSEDALQTSKAFGNLIDSTARLNGERPPPRDTSHETEFRDSISRANADADRYKSERNQRMLIWFASAAVCFIAGIVCISNARKPEPSNVETAKPLPSDRQECPYCAELIKAEAKICRFCGRDVASWEGAQS
jgi:lipopolysaccharide export LptBFGC system permease protein LptF